MVPSPPDERIYLEALCYGKVKGCSSTDEISVARHKTCDSGFSILLLHIYFGLVPRSCLFRQCKAMYT